MFYQWLSAILLSFASIAAQAATPVLALGTVYTYSYCASENSCLGAPEDKTLEIKVARIEMTAGNPSPNYVFEVKRDGQISVVKLDQALWDRHVNKMVEYATKKEACEDGSLSNGYYQDETFSDETWEGQTVPVCGTGSDSEFQSAGSLLFRVPSPMPFRTSGQGSWPNGTTGGWNDYESVKKYYRDRFFVAAEYLEFLGLPAAPNTQFDIKFSLIKIEGP